MRGLHRFTWVFPAVLPSPLKFDRALAFLHNFWYARAGKRFNQVLKNDSECAMAYCGAALSYNHPFWDPPSQADEASAWALVQRGISGSEVPDAKNSTSQRWPPGTEMPGPEAKPFATRITATRWRLPTPNIRTMKPLCFIDHIVEVAFAANIEVDIALLKPGGSIASYATDNATPKIPFWQMVFKNVRVFFLGSDDFPKEAKQQAARDLNAALEAGWSGFEIGERIPLAEIARAHELVEHPARPGRVLVAL